MSSGGEARATGTFVGASARRALKVDRAVVSLGLLVNDLEFNPQSGRFAFRASTSGGGGLRAAAEDGPDAIAWARFERRTLAEYAASEPKGEAPIARAQLARVVIVPRADAADPQDIAASFARWGEAGKLALADGLSGARRRAAAAGERLVLWPRVGTLVSDIPGVLNVLRAHDDVGVLFDPVALLAPDSSRFAKDFLLRSAEVIAHAAAGIDAVYVTSEVPVGVDSDWLKPVIAAAYEARVVVCRGPRMGA